MEENDPRYVVAARELRDRCPEQMNAGLPLPPATQGKYDVSRARETGFTANQELTTEAPEGTEGISWLLDAA